MRRGFCILFHIAHMLYPHQNYFFYEFDSEMGCQDSRAFDDFWLHKQASKHIINYEIYDWEVNFLRQKSRRHLFPLHCHFVTQALCNYYCILLPFRSSASSLSQYHCHSHSEEPQVSGLLVAGIPTVLLVLHQSEEKKF